MWEGFLVFFSGDFLWLDGVWGEGRQRGWDGSWELSGGVEQVATGGEQLGVSTAKKPFRNDMFQGGP